MKTSGRFQFPPRTQGGWVVQETLGEILVGFIEKADGNGPYTFYADRTNRTVGFTAEDLSVLAKFIHDESTATK
jgi:hypothetical protein